MQLQKAVKSAINLWYIEQGHKRAPLCYIFSTLIKLSRYLLQTGALIRVCSRISGRILANKVGIERYQSVDETRGVGVAKICLHTRQNVEFFALWRNIWEKAVGVQKKNTRCGIKKWTFLGGLFQHLEVLMLVRWIEKGQSTICKPRRSWVAFRLL